MTAELPRVDPARIVDTIRAWQKLTEQLPPTIKSGSELAEDGIASPTYQVAYTAWAAIAQAIDHLHAMQALITEANMLHTYAPFALIRAAVENAAAAVWLLGPDDRKTRLTRALRLTYEDMNQGAAAYELLATAPPPPRSPEVRKREVVDVAMSLGINAGAVGGQFSYEGVVRRAAEHTALEPDLAVYTWRLCSGYAHGRQWAALQALSRQTQASDTEGVTNVRFSTDIDQVMLLASLPVLLNNKALYLYEQRRLA